MRRILTATNPMNTRTMKVLGVLAALTTLGLTACGAAEPEADAAVRPTTETVEPTVETPERQATPTTAATQPPTTADAPTALPPTTTEAPEPTPGSRARSGP